MSMLKRMDTAQDMDMCPMDRDSVVMDVDSPAHSSDRAAIQSSSDSASLCFSSTSKPSYWIGVVSEAHVQRGVAGGFAQLCHGKAAPLRKMKQGDWFVYYSPRTEIKGGEPLQSFTAIGRVRDDEVYEYAMSDTFVPFRRNIDYMECQQASIRGLLDQLSFTRDNRNWGYLFRRGQFQITADDFHRIAEAMGVEIEL
jgi:hypothetical protein